MKVSYGQKGYSGSSMSLRAIAAYEDGEMPKSKWTKRAILEAAEALAYENDRVLLESTLKLSKDQCFNELIEWRSWHHTGKFANETNFYGIDEDAVLSDEYSRPLTDAELAEIQQAHQEHIEHLRALKEEQEQREKEMLAELERLGVERPQRRGITRSVSDTYYSFAVQEMIHPEMFERTISKRGNEIIYMKNNPSVNCTVTDALYRTVSLH